MQTKRPATSVAEAFWRKPGSKQQLASLYDLWDELAPKRRTEWLALGRALMNVDKRKNKAKQMKQQVQSGGRLQFLPERLLDKQGVGKGTVALFRTNNL